MFAAGAAFWNTTSGPKVLSSGLGPKLPALSGPASVLVAVAETALGAAGVVGVVVTPSTPLAGSVALESATPVAAAAAALLFVGYAADAGRLLRARSNAPCGCGASDQPVNQWVVVRAAAYACLGLVAALTRPALGALAPLEAITAIVAAGVIGLLLWLLPRTLAIPQGFAMDTSRAPGETRGGAFGPQTLPVSSGTRGDVLGPDVVARLSAKLRGAWFHETRGGAFGPEIRVDRLRRMRA